MSWWTTALKIIPWAALLEHAPKIIDSAASLRATAPAPQPPETGPKVTPDSFVALEARVHALEAATGSAARLSQQMATQLEETTKTLYVLAARVRILLAISALSGALALAALVLSFR